jgi:hypothetical protein
MGFVAGKGKSKEYSKHEEGFNECKEEKSKQDSYF